MRVLHVGIFLIIFIKLVEGQRFDDEEREASIIQMNDDSRLPIKAHNHTGNIIRSEISSKIRWPSEANRESGRSVLDGMLRVQQVVQRYRLANSAHSSLNQALLEAKDRVSRVAASVVDPIRCSRRYLYIGTSGYRFRCLGGEPKQQQHQVGRSINWASAMSPSNMSPAYKRIFYLVEQYVNQMMAAASRSNSKTQLDG